MNKFNLREVNVKPRINKANKQINFSVSKRRTSQDIINKMCSGRKVRFLLEDD